MKKLISILLCFLLGLLNMTPIIAEENQSITYIKIPCQYIVSNTVKQTEINGIYENSKIFVNLDTIDLLTEQMHKQINENSYRFDNIFTFDENEAWRYYIFDSSKNTIEEHNKDLGEGRLWKIQTKIDIDGNILVSLQDTLHAMNASMQITDLSNNMDATPLTIYNSNYILDDINEYIQNDSFYGLNEFVSTLNGNANTEINKKYNVIKELFSDYNGHFLVSADNNIMNDTISTLTTEDYKNIILKILSFTTDESLMEVQLPDAQMLGIDETTNDITNDFSSFMNIPLEESDIDSEYRARTQESRKEMYNIIKCFGNALNIIATNMYTSPNENINAEENKEESFVNQINQAIKELEQDVGKNKLLLDLEQSKSYESVFQENNILVPSDALVRVSEIYPKNTEDISNLELLVGCNLIGDILKISLINNIRDIRYNPFPTNEQLETVKHLYSIISLTKFIVNSILDDKIENKNIAMNSIANTIFMASSDSYLADKEQVSNIDNIDSYVQNYLRVRASNTSEEEIYNDFIKDEEYLVSYENYIGNITPSNKRNSFSYCILDINQDNKKELLILNSGGFDGYLGVFTINNDDYSVNIMDVSSDNTTRDKEQWLWTRYDSIKYSEKFKALIIYGEHFSNNFRVTDLITLSENNKYLKHSYVLLKDILHDVSDDAYTLHNIPDDTRIVLTEDEYNKIFTEFSEVEFIPISD